jgi:hypothetical protein
MSVLKILVDVPSDIMNGLKAGYYTRDAAGIIRWSRGTENGGEIVAHLREIGSDWQTGQTIGPNPLLPIGAFMAVQVAGFAYLGYQLKHVQEAITSLHRDVGAILNQIEIIREQQCLNRLNFVAHGIEHLRDAEFRPELLSEAGKSFGKARGEIRLFLEMQSSVALIEHLPQTDLLIQGTAISFVGEYVCLQKQRAGFDEISHVCMRYASIVSRAKQKILEAPPIHKPPLQSSVYLKYSSESKSLSGRLNAIEERIQAEREFVEALAKVDPTVLNDLAGKKVENEYKSLMVLYP